MSIKITKMQLIKKNLSALYNICILALILMPCFSHAEMKIIPDNELSNVYARGLSIMKDEELDKVNGQAGFANVTLRNEGNMHIVQADLKLDIELYASIDKLKLGKYPYSGQKGAKLIWPLNWSFNDESYVSNWDIEFEGLQMGENLGSPVKLGGLIIRADFEQTASGKVLNRFIIGSDDVTGMMYIQRPKGFTGLMNTQLAANSNFLVEWMPPTWTRRTYILNGESHGGTESLAGDTLLQHVGQKGMSFSGSGNGHGFHIVIDKDQGIGVWAGFPISDIDTGNAWDYSR